MQVHVVTRSQHAKVGRCGFGGPDQYMAVVEVPEGVEFDPQRTPLREEVLLRKGIRIFYCGQFYHAHVGGRKGSAYANCLARARKWVEELSAEEVSWHV